MISIRFWSISIVYGEGEGGVLESYPGWIVGAILQHEEFIIPIVIVTPLKTGIPLKTGKGEKSDEVPML